MLQKLLWKENTGHADIIKWLHEIQLQYVT